MDFFFRMVSVFLQSALDWWPKIDAVYCHSVELRNMFGETLHKAVQGCGAHPAIRMAPVRLIMKFEFYNQQTWNAKLPGFCDL